MGLKRTGDILVACLFGIALVLPAVANAANLTASSVTPIVAFDDTDSAGNEWLIWGLSDLFAISDVEVNTTILMADPDTRSTAFGYMASAGGTHGIALGFDADATGNYSVALGEGALASKLQSTAIGPNALSSGWWGMALGPDTLSSGDYSLAIGHNARSDGWFATALGHRASAPYANTIILGAVPGVNDPDEFVPNEYASIGNGTTMPLAPLHVARDDGTAMILVSDSGPVQGPKTLFEIENNGNPEFRMTNTANNNSWVFSAGLRFVVKNNLGDWVMRVTDTGDLEIGGSLTEVSDRNRKHAIVPLDGDTVLAKLAQVPVSEWSYDNETVDQRHIGPMAQDFHAAFGLASGETRISARDMAGVNMAALQALNQKLERENADIRAELDALKVLVATLRDSLPATGRALSQR
ncbi:tail fiber domain-containing protein [Marinihelvus fidelis]|nr:tail fiber domain-containing protein [Marinihelvus fidelis]